MSEKTYLKHEQEAAGASPWTLRQRVAMILWEWCWKLFCRWTPKPFNAWRLIVFRCFGGTVLGKPFIHQRALIQIPWNLTLYDQACLGDGANAYSLGPIVIKTAATVAQEAYLCTGSHDLSDPTRPLITAPIIIEANAFIGARAFVMPGIHIGEGAVLGAMSVATKDVPARAVFAGNPAKQIGNR